MEYLGDFSDALKIKIKKRFAELGGAKNAGKVIPIPTEFKVSSLETNLVNKQFFELQGLTTRQIANGFGIKGFQLNDMEKSTYNNIEQQNRAFYSETLQNVLTEYEQEVEYKMISEADRKAGFYPKFNADVILQSDPETRMKVYESAIKNGWRSRAEVREKEDLPYKPGTDGLTVDNGACIPLEDLGKQYVKGGEEQNGNKT